MNDSEDVDLVECIVVGETDRAWRLRLDRPGGKEEWFPKSQISFKRRNTKTGKCSVEIPTWLIEEKRFW